MRAAVDYNFRYILTVDYDTVFTEYHILDLYDIMEANPDIDALIPLQIRRNAGVPIFESFRHQKDEDGEKSHLEFDDEEINADFFEVDSGHFGLTLIRTKNLHKLKKPWFRSVPSTDGDWEAGKTPADLYFWKNAKNAGLKICLAPKVYIGHLDLFCMWPGKPENGWRGVQMKAHESMVACPKWAVPPSMDRYENQLMKKKPKRKRCQHCYDLVPPEEWEDGLCDACMATHVELTEIISEYA
jgi:hypothetical protein